MDQDKRQIALWIAGGVVVFLVFGNGGFRQWMGAYREKKRLEKTLISLRSDSERLNQELSWIRQDPTYGEYLVRKNLGYVKKGEVEYRMLKNGKPTQTRD